jgi:two-component system cell cycle sensor histidine kinase PleC
MRRKLARPKQPENAREMPELPPSSIAIIDDLESNRSFLEHLAWRQPGVRYVMTFASAVDALASFASTPPDLVITDFHMPVMNAVDFLDRFRAVPEFQDVPVIVISSQNETRNRHRALLSGATDFLMVPFDPLEFQARTHNLMTLSLHQKTLRRQSRNLRSELLETMHRSQKTQNRFTSIIDSVPALVFTVNGEGQVVFANQYCFEFFGILSRLGLRGVQFLADRIREIEQQSEPGAAQPPREVPLTGLDGNEHIFLVIPNAIDGEDGEVLTVYSGIEITQLKATERSLRHAKNEAEAANRAKSAFLSNMTHEIRTPLNAIIGFSDAIENELHGPIGNVLYKEYLRDIQVSARHLLTIINEILDFSQIEAQRQAINLSCFSLKTCLEEVRILTKMQLKQAHNQLIIDDVPDIRLYTDHQKLSHVFINLVSNANGATQGGVIRVSAAMSSDGGTVVTISDNGIGMDKEELALAVTEFGRAVAPAFVSDGLTGTGLGLPISIRLMQLLGGDLRVESEKGVGTKARVILPGRSIMKETVRAEHETTDPADAYGGRMIAGDL